MSPAYVIRGGSVGLDRLRVVGRTMHASTTALLDRLALPSSARCWDVGCAGGSVTRELARRCPEGLVVGTDIDAVKLDIAAAECREDGLTNVELRCDDISSPSSRGERPAGCDLVYARFLLSHLPDPAAALRTMVAALGAGGVVVVEDVDTRGSFCHPPNMAFDRQRAIYDQTVRAGGGDPFLGGQLPQLLAAAGLAQVGVHVVQPAALDGELKTIPALTLAAVSDAALDRKVARREEIVRTLHELVDYAARPDTLIGLPRIVQSWGYKPC